MLQTITSLDSQILFWIQQNIRSDSATLFWEFMTDLGNIETAVWLIQKMGSRHWLST